ncbi:MAG: hydantoinase/oxoprolinase family protein [Alphaproteobacteria bacterium]|nr:hydantoinase/oxoprolinase family protein [Alphaproteobacteria bacterium]
MSYRLAVDIGGTFVDAIVFNPETGALRLEKDFTTPDDASRGVLSAIERLEVRLAEVETFVHGTTLGLNTVLERTGAPTGIITNEGFEDIFEMGRYDRPREKMYMLTYDDPPVLVRKRYRLGVPCRLNAQGDELVPLDEDAVRAVAKRLVEELGRTSIAVCYLHAYRNPEHEQRTKAIVEEMYPDVPVSVSSDIVREYREYERTSTTVVNAYVKPIFRTYIARLEENLARAGFDGAFYVTRSGGGALRAHDSAEVPVHTIFSGPAGGLIGAVALSELTGRPDLIAVDMGGTSTDACVVHGGAPSLKYEAALERLPLMIPTYDINTIGAGGGSIARAEDGLLRVGPQSAGASPGPVCYARGGTAPTFTDAALTMGYLDPARFLGGAMTLDAATAEAAIKTQIADPLDLSVADACRGIFEVLLAKTVSAVREITVEAGLDPREFAMLAFGGAGPMFVPLVGRELGVKEVIVPQAPSVFSAWGMLMTDIVQEYGQTVLTLLDDLDMAGLADATRQLESQAQAGLTDGGFAADRQLIERAAEMRYFGQEHSLEVSIDGVLSIEELRTRFDEAHRRRYGHAMEDPVQLVNLRVRGIGRESKPELPKVPARAGKAGPVPTGTRQAYCFARGGDAAFRVYDRNDLRHGDVVAGPAIVEEATTTIVFFSDQAARVDEFGQLVISREVQA